MKTTLTLLLGVALFSITSFAGTDSARIEMSAYSEEIAKVLTTQINQSSIELSLNEITDSFGSVKRELKVSNEIKLSKDKNGYILDLDKNKLEDSEEIVVLTAMNS